MTALSAWHAARNAAVAATYAECMTRFGLRPLTDSVDADVPPIIGRLFGGAVWAWQPGTASSDNASIRVGIAGRRLHVGHLSLARDVARFQENGFPVTFVGRPGRDAEPVRLLIERIGQFGGVEPTRTIDLDAPEVRAFEDRVLESLTLGRMSQVYGWCSTTPLKLLQDAVSMMSFFLYESGEDPPIALVDAGQIPHTALLRTVSRRLRVPTPHVAYRRLIPDLRSTTDRASVHRPDSTIFLDEPPDVVRRRFMTAMTGGRASADEQRSRGGDPTVCPTFEVIELLCAPGRAAVAAERCRAGTVLCRDCKIEHADEAVAAITRSTPRAGTSTVVPAALRNAARTLYCPPPPSPVELEAGIARFAGVAPEQVVVGNGSTEILDWIMREQAELGRSVLATAPTFELYEQLARRHGLRYDPVPWDAEGYSHDLDWLAASVTGEHVALVADIPHTVSGASVPLADLLASVAPRLDGGAKLVIDNVYGEYMARPVAVTPQLLQERGELVVCRSLSKAHCLLGARVGYAVTSAAYAARLRRHQLPYGISSLASAAAHASLRDAAALRRNIEANRQAYRTVTGELDRLGIRYAPTDANFLLIDLGDRREQVLATLRACGLRFRDGARWQLMEMIQVHLIDEAHVEVTREIARRFNYLYGDVFPVPELVQAETPTLVGTDGRAKMSKSLGNAIALSDEPAVVRKKVMGMYTDPNRVRADVPGTVEGNPVFAYHDVFNPDKAAVEDLKARYREGKVGDVEVKEKLTVALNAFLDPMRERRALYEADKGRVDELIVEGTERTRREVQQTVFDVRKAMGLTGVYTQIRRKAERSRKASATA